MPAKKTKGKKSISLQGIGVSPGVVVGPAFKVGRELVPVVEREILKKEVDHEICRIEDALIETRRQIRDIQKNLASQTGMASASVLDAHLMVLDDRAFLEEVLEQIKSQRMNAESVLTRVSEGYVKVLASVEDDYLRERVADIKDVTRRIIKNLSGATETTISDLTEKHIIVAADLSPSETAGLRKDTVLGFATDIGSATSHTAVMARALEIPAVVGLHDVSKQVMPGDEILIDGNKGLLIIRPTQKQLERYGKLEEARRNIQMELTTLHDRPAETKDGRRIVLSANVEAADEVEAVLNYGAEGVGLFRSEYLYLTKNDIVSEDDQAKAYSEVAAKLAPAPVIIRSLDLGGDKLLQDGEFAREMNPFLGCRSIRLSLLYPDQFKSQLRAILRASREGNVKLMYPMISNVGEVVRANELLAEAKLELKKAEVPFDDNIEVGVMIEIPAAALTANALAEHVDFFSIGTNDLVQYSLAVDRVNERVAYLYEPTHPAVLELMRMTIAAAHDNKLWVGLCGEMAADPMLTMLLIGMGIDELSVAPSAVPLVKDAIRNVTLVEAEELAAVALKCRSAVEVLAHCRRLTKKVAPELLELM